jgi:D-serine deaminase-like pyridoxal phosphate-dependent protein
MSARGIALRPHVKSSKSVPVARLATAGHSGAITVSTLAEAAYFLEHGFHDITYAVCMAPGKLQQAAELMARGADLKIIVDSIEAAAAIAAFQGAARFQVMIEIDCGDARTGVLPDAPELVEIGRNLADAPNAALIGVLTHGGHSYEAADIPSIQKVAREEREAVVRAAQRLREAGLPCPVVSAGSTPTAVHGESYEGLTEMRPGVYVFFDLDQLSRKACAREDLALSVLGTVIAHNRHAGQIVTDTGALALSKDISANSRWPETGYGEVCDMHTLEPLAKLHVAKVSQEHGIVPLSGPQDFEQLPIGARVRILPNHACITAAAYTHYEVLEGTHVVDRWERMNGWDYQ